MIRNRLAEQPDMSPDSMPCDTNLEFLLVRKIIAEQLNISLSSIHMDTFLDDLGADSLDLFQITMAVEENMNVKIDITEYESIKTVSDILKYIKKTLD